MKNTVKRIIASVLCFAVMSGCMFAANASAYSEFSAVPSFMNLIVDFFERITSIFSGSTNPDSDINFEYEQGEIFTAKEHFNSAHASTVCKMSDGSLISAWFAGSAEKGSDVRIWCSVYRNGAWSEPKQVPSVDNCAHWNPVLQNFGEYTRLYYKAGPEISGWVTKYVDTYDFGETWSEPKELVAGDTSGGRGPVKNKSLVTSSGIIIAPASTEQGTWRAFFDISTDGGETWQKTDYIVAKDMFGSTVEMIQPTLWEDSEGGIHAMFRTKAGYIYRSDSFDGGFTWSEAYATELMNNNSGIDCVTTDNGWLWLVHNPIGIEGFRNKLALSVSKDNGETWENVVMLEDNTLNLFAEYSYPAIIAEGNTLYITYTYTRTTINYAFIQF